MPTRAAPPAIVPVLLGLGLGALVFSSRRMPHPRTSLREQAIAAQEVSARASQVARDLTAQWRAEVTRNCSERHERGAPRSEE